MGEKRLLVTVHGYVALRVQDDRTNINQLSPSLDKYPVKIYGGACLKQLMAYLLLACSESLFYPRAFPSPFGSKILSSKSLGLPFLPFRT